MQVDSQPRPDVGVVAGTAGGAVLGGVVGALAVVQDPADAGAEGIVGGLGVVDHHGVGC